MSQKKMFLKVFTKTDCNMELKKKHVSARNDFRGIVFTMTIGVLMSKGAARYSNQTNRRYFID